MRPSKFEFNVYYRAVIKHQGADVLSGLRTLKEDITPLENGLFILAINEQCKNSGHICVMNKKSDNTILTDAQSNVLLHTSSTEEDCVVEKALNHFRKPASLQDCHTNTNFHLCDRGILIRKSIVDGAILIVVAEFILDRILYILRFPPIPKYPSLRKHYDTLQGSYNRLHSTNDV